MKHAARIGTLVMVAALSACATSNSAHDPRDPLEGFNRTMFNFNDAIDNAALKPAAQAYQSVLPKFVQAGIGNFFGNIGDLLSMVNQLLQGRIEASATSFMRVAVNTVFGLGGLLDVSTEARLPKQKSDFGQTLGRWGVGSGPYVVLPLLGPSTVRDAAALPVDYYGDPWGYKDPVRWRHAGSVVRIVDKRAQLLNASSFLEDAALDRYDFLRDTYLQSRQAHIDRSRSNGNKDDEDDEDGGPTGEKTGGE